MKIYKPLFTIIIFSLLTLGTLFANDFNNVRKNVDLNIGETTEVTLYDGTTVTIRIVQTKIIKDRIRLAIREAKIKVAVDGEEKWITAGNYNLPIEYEKVKIDIPIIRAYFANANFPDDMWKLAKDVRLRVWPVNQPVNPDGLIAYPIDQKFLATNTTAALEPVEIDHDNVKPNPYDKIYYHWGIDMAGVKAVTPVLAAGDGEVICVGTDHIDDPIFDLAGPRFDRIFVKMENGWVYRYSHLHSFNVTLGQHVNGGDQIAILGNNWSDFAHEHFEIWSLNEDGEYIIEVAYPYIWESYVGKHQPKLIAVAKPHRYIGVGDEVELDAAKSISFEGKIVKYEWSFHDGSTATGIRVTKKYNEPGYFSEMVKVTDDKGNTEYDFIHVTVVYDNKPNKKYGYTTVNYYPTFNLQPEQEITFKGRYFNVFEGEDHWDFGDGSPIEISHSNPDGNSQSGYVTKKHTYQKAGHYIVSFSRTTNEGITATTNLSIQVGEPNSISEHKKKALITLNSGNLYDLTKQSVINYYQNYPASLKIRFMEINGNTVFMDAVRNQQKGIHNIQIPTGLSSGNYLLIFQSKDNQVVKKIILY